MTNADRYLYNALMEQVIKYDIQSIKSCDAILADYEYKIKLFSKVFYVEFCPINSDVTIYSSTYHVIAILRWNEIVFYNKKEGL